MKTNTIIFTLFCLAAVANASWFDNLKQSRWFSHIMNHTALRGKLGVSTEKGLDLNYNGSLGYKNGDLALDIANVGANFNVETQNSSIKDNEYNKTYTYSGNLAVDSNGHKANVSLNGTAEVGGDYNGTGDGKGADYNFHARHRHQYNATANQAQAVGGHIGGVKVRGHVERNGSLIKAEHDIKGFTGTCANVTNNGSQIASGFVVKGGKAKVFSHTYLTGGNASEVNFHGHHEKPDAITGGKAYYKQFTKFGWNNETRAYTKEGKAGYEGIVWAGSGKDDNNTYSGFGVAKNVDFTHKGQIWENGKKVADTLAVGDLAFLKKAGAIINKNGTWEKGMESTGTFNQWTLGKRVGEKADFDSFFEADNQTEEFKINCILGKYSNNKTLQEACEKASEDRHHKDHGAFMSKFKANWAHKSGARGTVNDHNGAVVDFKSGTLYRFGGHDSESRKPWEHHGYKTVAGTYKAHAEKGQPGDLSIEFGN